MKKTILGSAMLISGVIGFALWVLACSNTVEHGAYSRVWRCLNSSEWIAAIAFLALAIVGFVIAWHSIKEEK